MTRADMVYWGILQSLPISYDAVEEYNLFLVIIAAIILLSVCGRKRKPDYPPDYYRHNHRDYPPYW